MMKFNDKIKSMMGKSDEKSDESNENNFGFNDLDDIINQAKIDSGVDESSDEISDDGDEPEKPSKKFKINASGKLGKNSKPSNSEDGIRDLIDAQKIINGTDVDYISEDSKTITEIIDFYLKNPKDFDTLSFFYKEESEDAVLVVAGPDRSVKIESMNGDRFNEICKKYFRIDASEEFNQSKSFISSGALIRSFAMIKPVSAYPNITVSAATPSELTWDDSAVEDALAKVARENFILVGASGAGKTYLMNYLLRKTHKNSKSKIGIIEEFSELFEPNESTFKLTTPPVKPGEESLLRFLTEQSNLMRLDYLYVGEIKSAEAWPFVSNLSSGTKGAATLHGSSADDGLQRLKHLCMLSNINPDVIDRGIAKSIKYVIYIEEHEIKEIAELTKVSMNGNFQKTTLFERKDGKIVKNDPDKKVR